MNNENIFALVRTALALLQMRKSGMDRELSEAIAAGQWSKLAGLHGMREGLAAAARHLAGEQPNIRSAKELQTMAAAFAANARECDEQRSACLVQMRYGEVAAHDGVGTGWLLAKKVVEDELAALR